MKGRVTSFFLIQGILKAMGGNSVVVVGLGNPGGRYDETRHNVGFAVVDLICHWAQVFPSNFTLAEKDFAPSEEGTVCIDALKGSFASAGWNPKGDCAVFQFRWASSDVTLLKPLSYMNRSGEPLSAFLRFRKLPIESVIVVHDEIDLPLGVVRIKRGGGEGGHNGLRSISRLCGGREYLRLRVGVGKPSPSDNAFLGDDGIARWVLSKFSPDERSIAGPLIAHSALAVLETISKGVVYAQNRFHR